MRFIVKLGAAHTNWQLRCDEEHPLHPALLGHHFELAQFFIDLKLPNEHMIVCLMLAVKRGDRLAAEFLLQTGADPNITGMIDVGPMLKMTALQTASCQPESLWSSDDSPKIRLEMVKLLLDAGADPKTPRFTTDTEDRSPLAWAVFSYETGVVKLLLDHGSRCFNLSRA